MIRAFPFPLSRSSLLLLFAGVIGSAASLPATARADGATHEIRKTEPKVAAGGKGNASLTIAAKNGWHVNGEAPITVSLSTTDAGLTVSKPKLSRGDLVESSQQAARFDIAFACTDPGKKTITAEAKFVMCQESACKPVKETLAFNIEVTPAAPAAPPAAKKSKGRR
jgi:DsbC/DsbD-like thiol-disulfide interchange protein